MALDADDRVCTREVAGVLAEAAGGELSLKLSEHQCINDMMLLCVRP